MIDSNQGIELSVHHSSEGGAFSRRTADHPATLFAFAIKRFRLRRVTFLLQCQKKSNRAATESAWDSIRRAAARSSGRLLLSVPYRDFPTRHPWLGRRLLVNAVAPPVRRLRVCG